MILSPAQLVEIDAITSPARRLLVQAHLEAGRADLAIRALALSDAFCAEQDRRLWWGVVLGMTAALMAQGKD